MKELNVLQKAKVIKLFFSGLTYDEIGQQVGIAKGSVVNIVDEFREGDIPFPPGLTEYIDELRKLAVNMKKHDTNITQLTGYLKLHAKLKEMGVGSEQMDAWLDICQDITTPSVSSNQFVQAAIELAQLTSSNGPTYAEVMTDYNAKLDTSKKLDHDIKQKEEELGHLKAQCKEEKLQATGALNSINKAIATTQDTLQKQKMYLESKLNEYMAQNKLSWKNVGIVMAVLSTELGNADLNQEEIDEISRQIATAGSLVNFIKQLEQRRDELHPQVDHLAKDKAVFSNHLKQLQDENVKAFQSLFEKKQREQKVDDRLEEKTEQFTELEQIVSGHVDDIDNVHMILGFLLSPEKLSEIDIDNFIKLMIYSKHYKKGIDPQQLKYKDGNMLFECKVPRLDIDLDKYEVDIDEARKKLALCLVPLVKDKFMPKFEYDMAQLTQLRQGLSELQHELHDLL